MEYPPHKSAQIVGNYAPLVKQALEVWPEVCEFRPDGVRLTTFVARLRDTIKALQEYEYEDFPITFDEREMLARLKTRCLGDRVQVGSKNALTAFKSEPVGQLTRVDTVGLCHTIDTPTEELLKAIGVCLRYGVFESINIKGVSEREVAEILPDVTITKLNNTLIIYHG